MSGETERPGQGGPPRSSREQWAQQQQMFATSSGQRRTLASTRECYSYVSKHTGHYSEPPARSSRKVSGGVEGPAASEAPEDPTEAAAEELVHAGVLGGRLEESRTEAVRQLQQALSTRSPHVALWIEACERLKATAAAEWVERVLATSPPGDELFAAIDAARAVIRPSPQPGQAWRVAERLDSLAEELLPSKPFIAARALLGATLLAGPASWPRLHPRLACWPAMHLNLTLKLVCRQLSSAQPRNRSSLPEVTHLRREALALEQRLRAQPPKEARFTRADLLILLGWLAPLAPLEETIELLHGLYSQNEPVVRVGAIDAVQIIGREHPEVFRLLVDKPQGPRLLQAAMASRKPVERTS